MAQPLAADSADTPRGAASGVADVEGAIAADDVAGVRDTSCQLRGLRTKGGTLQINPKPFYDTRHVMMHLLPSITLLPSS
jgi:hypothetical protein